MLNSAALDILKRSKQKPRGTHGGKRKGAGKPKGVKWPTTLARETAKEQYRQAVITELQPLVQSQIKTALGQMAEVAVVQVTAAGMSFRKVTDERELASLVDEGGHVRIVLTEPDMNISKYLTDQAIGKAETPAPVSAFAIHGPATVNVIHKHVASS